MPDREHTSKHYEQQLRELKSKLLLMSHKAEQMISDSIRSLVERRPSLAEEVIGRDDEIDKLEILHIAATRKRLVLDLASGFIGEGNPQG